MVKRLQATVIGDSVATQEAAEMAFQVGVLLARLGFVVITGGRGGVMAAAAQGAVSEGGLTIGLLPREDQGESNESNTVTIPTGIGWARNSMNVLAGDIVVAVGGGAGTLTEICYAWVYNKPIFACISVPGWAQEMAGKAVDSKRNDVITGFSSVEELEAFLLHWMKS